MLLVLLLLLLLSLLPPLLQLMLALCFKLSASCIAEQGPNQLQSPVQQHTPPSA
jgi:hypothetical protein